MFASRMRQRLGRAVRPAVRGVHAVCVGCQAKSVGVLPTKLILRTTLHTVTSGHQRSAAQNGRPTTSRHRQVSSSSRASRRLCHRPQAPRGLEHLFFPLVTSASSPPKRRSGSVLPPTALADLEQPGAISVIETTIQVS